MGAACFLGSIRQGCIRRGGGEREGTASMGKKSDEGLPCILPAWLSRPGGRADLLGSHWQVGTLPWQLAPPPSLPPRASSKSHCPKSHPPLKPSPLVSTAASHLPRGSPSLPPGHWDASPRSCRWMGWGGKQEGRVSHQSLLFWKGLAGWPAGPFIRQAVPPALAIRKCLQTPFSSSGPPDLWAN